MAEANIKEVVSLFIWGYCKHCPNFPPTRWVNTAQKPLLAVMKNPCKKILQAQEMCWAMCLLWPNLGFWQLGYCNLRANEQMVDQEFDTYTMAQLLLTNTDPLMFWEVCGNTNNDLITLTRCSRSIGQPSPLYLLWQCPISPSKWYQSLVSAFSHWALK